MSEWKGGNRAKFLIAIGERNVLDAIDRLLKEPLKVKKVNE